MFYWNRHTSQRSFAKCFIGLFSHPDHGEVMISQPIPDFPESVKVIFDGQIMTPSGGNKPGLNLKRKVKFQDMMQEQPRQAAIKFYQSGKRNQLQLVCCFSVSLMSFQENNLSFQPIRVKFLNANEKSSTNLKTLPYQYHRVLHRHQELLSKHSPFLRIFTLSRII